MGGASAIAVIAVGAGLLYGLRGLIGARLAVQYLASRGVPAEIDIDRLDWGGFSGRARLGPAADPDLTVDRVEAEFAAIPILRSGLAAPRIRSLRLVHPRLKAAYDGKRFNLGTLQPLVDQALSAPPGAGPGPNVEIERGEVRLASFAGPALITGDAEIQDGRLRRARGHLAPTRLRLRPDLALNVRSADLSLDGREDRLNADLDLALDRVDGPLALGPARLQGTASLPYGPAGLTTLDGAVAADFHLHADSLTAQGAKARGLDLGGRFGGTAHGRPADLTLDLAGQGTVAAQRLERAAAGADAVRLAWSGRGLHWFAGELSAAAATFKAQAARASAPGAPDLTLPKATMTLSGLKIRLDPVGWRGGAGLSLAASADQAVQATPAGRLTLASLNLKGRGRADLDPRGALAITLAGALSGRGGLDTAAARALGSSLAMVGDAPRIEAALRSFALSATAWRLAMKDGAAEIRADQPLRLSGASGPMAILSPVAGQPLTRVDAKAAAGGFAVAVSGQGVPGLDLTVARYRLAGGQGQAEASLRARFDSAMLHGADIGGAGTAAFAGGTARFTPSGCLDASLARLGEDAPPLAQGLHARLCNDGPAPLASFGPAGWRVQARIEQAAADLPVSQARVDGGEARLMLAGRSGPVTGRLELTGLHAVDAAPTPRFNPVRLAGALALADGQWRGPLRVVDAAKGRPLAVVTVRQAMAGADGEAQILADALDFKPGALQPVELSPLAALISKVDAHARFVGQIAWKDGAVTSGGRFTSSGTAFNSPFGQVSGAAVDVAFSSLLPPRAAPGQLFTARQIVWIAPLTDISARFALTAEATELSEAHATVAHGLVGVGALTLPFAQDRPLMGVLTLKQLDLGELVAGSSLADSVSIQARVDGTVPFTAGPAGVRVTDGVVASVGAGRLSIKRQALTGAVATAGAAGAQPNAVQDFAYQALENLAFDSLEARLATRPQGRLGVVFHIKGRNDPARPTDTRIGLFDLLRGHAFDKPIDLPKGTPVDLTLDTSLNFDELLKAYGQIGKGSGPVQP